MPRNRSICPAALSDDIRLKSVTPQPTDDVPCPLNRFGLTDLTLAKHFNIP